MCVHLVWLRLVEMGLHWKVILISLLNLTIAFSFEFISNEEVLKRKPDKELWREINQETTYVGDMMFLRSDTRTARSTSKTWPNKIIPYIVSSNVTKDLRPVIAKAIEYFHNYTCIKFRPRVDADTYWIRFLMKENPKPGTLCSSFIGFLNRTDQAVSLGPKCFFGSMVHELLHAVGFQHEHNRNDRDSFIKLNDSNIESKDQYIKECKDSTPQCTYNDYGLNYNYESIMHYCPRCGTNGKGPAFTVLNNTKALGDPKKTGQREGFSKGDSTMVNKRYNCTKITEPPPLSDTPDMQDPDDTEETPGVDDNTEEPPKTTTAGTTISMSSQIMTIGIKMCRPTTCRVPQDCPAGCYCVNLKCSGSNSTATTTARPSGPGNTSPTPTPPPAHPPTGRPPTARPTRPPNPPPPFDPDNGETTPSSTNSTDWPFPFSPIFGPDTNSSSEQRSGPETVTVKLGSEDMFFLLTE